MFGHNGGTPASTTSCNCFSNGLTSYAGMMGILERILFTALSEKDFKPYAHDHLHPVH